MKQLTEYTKHGSKFTQYCRTGDLAIFHGIHGKTRAETWEVIHVQSHNGREIGGQILPPAEFAPSDTQWGRLGFTCLTPDSARNRFEVELQKINQKKQ